MTQEIYTTDENGNSILINTIEIPDPILQPNWIKLTNDLYSSNTFNYALNTSNILNLVMYTTLLKVLTDGENGSPNATEEVFLNFLSKSMIYTLEQKTEINGILINNNFSVQLI